MRRRDFLYALSGSAVAWPLAALAQQQSMPVIGLLSTRGPRDSAQLVAAFKQGLSEAGYIDGRNVAIEYRWAEGQYDRLPALAADLVRHQVGVIFAPGVPATLAAKATTTKIPIVFTTGDDPVKSGLVESLNHPGGNITGINLFASELGAKRLGLLRQLVPKSKAIVMLVNPSYSLTEALTGDVQSAAAQTGQEIHIISASNENEITRAFAAFAELHADALIVGADPFFTSRADQLVKLAAQNAIPAIYEFREFTVAGGLMSYGTSLTDAYRQCGVYTGCIFKGEKPGDLPVVQSTKFEFVINLKTAKALGLTVAPGLISIADEVIE